MEVYYLSTIYFLSDNSKINNNIYEKIETILNRKISGCNTAYLNTFSDFDKIAIKTCATFSKSNPFFNSTIIRPTFESFLHPENDPNAYLYKYADKTILYNIDNLNDNNEILNCYKTFIDFSDIIICYINENNVSISKTALEYARKQGKIIFNLF